MAIDADTLALFHFDEFTYPNIIDSSGKAIGYCSANDSNLISTTQKKMGMGSLNATINNKYLSFNNRSNVFNSNFQKEGTIECWIYLTSSSGMHPILSITNSNDGFIYWLFSVRDGYFGLTQDSNGSSVVASFPNTCLNKWTHVAVAWGKNTNSNWDSYVFIDGQLIRKYTNQNNSIFSNITWNASNGTSRIGNIYWWNSPARIWDTSFGGYIDELRFSKVCRYTSNFTPSTTPFGAPLGFIQSTQSINLLDKTSITGITVTGIEPANTSRRLIFQVDGTWNKLTADENGIAALSAVTTQTPTVDSILAEGNTIAELNTIASIPDFVGKQVYPAAALYASADATEMPTLGLTINAEEFGVIDSYEHVEYSQEYVLGDDEVNVISITAETTITGNGSADIYARLYSDNEWSEYELIDAIENELASKVQIKVVYKVQDINVDSVHVDDVVITY